MLRRTLPLLLTISLGCVSAANISFTGPGGSIPDFDTNTLTPGVFISDIIIVNPAVLVAAGNNVAVTLVGLQHDFAGDLVANLTFIGAVTLNGDLFNQIGVVNPGDFGSSSNFGDAFANYAFRSDFAGDLWALSALLGDVDFFPGGPYFTTDAGGTPNSLSALFNGQAIAGIWRLTITDNAADGAGSLTEWQLDLEVASAVPEPASVLLVAAGLCAGLIAARRRRSGSRIHG